MRAVETAEEKIAELSQVILDQRNHHESKINELTVRIQEKDDHIAQIGDLLKQKELTIGGELANLCQESILPNYFYIS